MPNLVHMRRPLDPEGSARLADIRPPPFRPHRRSRDGGEALDAIEEVPDLRPVPPVLLLLAPPAAPLRRRRVSAQRLLLLLQRD